MNTSARFELKFLITATRRDQWLSHFERELLADTHAGESGVYPIVSLYYDTPDRRCYWEAWRGVPSRRKLRVRVYGTACGGIPPTCFVEIKHKLDGLGVKRRVQTTLPRALGIGAGLAGAEDFSPSDARVVREVHRLVHADGFRPVCVLRYRRSAFSLALENLWEPLRITFDDEITGRFRDLDPEPDDQRHDFTLLPPDQIVMELKGAGAVPYPIVAALKKCGLSSRSYSKYCAAVRLAGIAPS